MNALYLGKVRTERAVAAGASKGFSTRQGKPASQDTRASQFYDWAVKGGAKFDKLTEASFKGVRGLKAKTTIAKGEEIVSIPRRIALWVTPRSSCPFPQWIDSKYFKQAPWSVKLALKLLHEKRRGKESQVAGYIANLPETVDAPVFWPPELRAQLCCPFLRRAVEEQAARWNEWYTSLRASSPHCDVSQSDYNWALLMVYSRTFSGPFIGSSIQERLNLLLLIAGATALTLTFGVFPEDRVINAAISAVLFNFLYELLLSRNLQQYALCPVIDLMNHDSSLEAEVSYDYFRDGYSVLAGRQFGSGEQAFISYGRQTSDSLMQYYGFVEDGNANDVYTFADFGGLLARVFDLDGSRLEALSASGDAGFALALDRVTMNDKAQVQDEVKATLRYVLGLAPTLEAAREKVSNTIDGRMWAAVLAAAELEYANMGRTLEEDERALRDVGRTATERQTVLLAYNIMKKRFLLERIAQLRTRVEKML